MASPPRAALTIDAESFAHTPAYRTASGTVPDPDVGPEQIDRLVETLDAHEATATWFVVGELARDHPDRIERVASKGHEIASHTMTHRHLTELDADRRRSELRDSRESLEALTGQPVAGFRAPSFEIAADHFEMLAETGYRYDSSTVPCRSIPGWYGGEWSTQRPTTADTIQSGAPASIGELPVAVMPGLRLPLTGTWLRFFGVRYTIAGMRWLARRGIAPVLYVHPWEFADLPRVEGVPRRVYVRTGAWMWRALERILNTDFEFVTARSVLESETDAFEPGTPADADG
ncbi:polysaccharide deacetylase family protein [Halorhabdus salina]|uniref:polysaccharide deacetylase family protein n=1 Tax=Halorhabdus salina TaxID=2750670 RepID=UPI0015EF745C|nr:polysaccharide deacetylase family protein [Halorhabdus salina]